jgi:ubiquinone/menaquinone biosynthesis C-methylase UbiE
MGLWARCCLPWLTDLAMRNRTARAERGRWIPEARGAVLEIGAGSGLNFPVYTRAVTRLWALDPSAGMARLARRRAATAACPVEFLDAPAEAVPLPDGSVDSVVSTWTLCSVADPGRALAEVRRVLRPGGRLVFVEHGRAPEAGVAAWQDRLTPLWRRVAGGCHMNRVVDRLLADGAFDLATLEKGYAQGPRILTYLYRGTATPR